MKKLALLFVMVLLLAGCKYKNDVEGKSFDVALGQEKNSEYKWKVTIDDEEIVKVTSKTEDVEDPDTEKVVYTVIATGVGDTKVSFDLVDKNGSRKSAIIYRVEVDRDLKIKETHVYK